MPACCRSCPATRPPLDRDDPSTNVHVRLSTKVYDELWRTAQRERVTLPDLIRHRVIGALPPPDRN
jgi:hypothetical protein